MRITKYLVALAVLLAALPAAAADTEKPAATILVAAAASLQRVFVDDLIPAFQAENPGVKVEGTYDSSGKLQAQIENGLTADVFMSAAPKQMNALVNAGLVARDSVFDVVENSLVLIRNRESGTSISRFEDILKAETIAVGDPASVPAGQYAQEVLTSLNIWNATKEKASLGTNVTEVLNWVAEGSAQAGIVYGTDAIDNNKVEVVADAPAGSLKNPVVYPAGMIRNSANQDAARAFLEFLKSTKAQIVFSNHGFKAINLIVM